MSGCDRSACWSMCRVCYTISCTDQVDVQTGFGLANDNDETTTAARRLLQLLELERIEENLYLGRTEERRDGPLFGGQVLSQALRAAIQTVGQGRVHSVHANFLRPGSSAHTVLYEVDRIRDGRSFGTRRVVAVQQGEAIFNMSVSFHVDEPGFEHAAAMPNVPRPDALADDLDSVGALAPQRAERIAPVLRTLRPFESRSVYPLGSDEALEPRFWNPVWLRFRLPVDAADQTLAACLLAYASNMGLMDTGTLPHQDTHSNARGAWQLASLDHALWMHRAVPISDWLLFHRHTTWAGGSRALSHGEFFAEDGALVASLSQEGLLRVANTS